MAAFPLPWLPVIAVKLQCGLLPAVWSLVPVCSVLCPRVHAVHTLCKLELQTNLREDITITDKVIMIVLYNF